MKKTLLFVVAALFSILVQSQEMSVFSIDRVSTEGYNVGDIIDVPVYFDDLSQPIALFQIFFEFDHSVLEYVETKDINPAFDDGWRDNHTPDFYAVVFLDMNKKGKIEKQLGKVCTLSFKYLGGDTDIKWGTKDEFVEKVKKMGVTKYIAVYNSTPEVRLIDGCVCSNP